MTSFEWADREGAVHRLISPTPIDEEVEIVSQEIDQLFLEIGHSETGRKTELRMAVGSLAARLETLKADAERWNAFAIEQTRVQAIELAQMIEKLNIEVLPMKIVSSLHSEHLQAMAEQEHRDALLAGPATKMQQYAVRRSTVEPKPSAEATRREVAEWLKNDPLLHRPYTDEGGWFEWKDAEGCIHRLLSPLRIENEIASIAKELGEKVPVLRTFSSHSETLHAMEAANALVPRLTVLQADHERFFREDGDREEEEWERFEMQWKTLRRSR